jgi:hypothetical protein
MAARDGGAVDFGQRGGQDRRGGIRANRRSLRTGGASRVVAIDEEDHHGLQTSVDVVDDGHGDGGCGHTFDSDRP